MRIPNKLDLPLRDEALDRVRPGSGHRPGADVPRGRTRRYRVEGREIGEEERRRLAQPESDGVVRRQDTFRELTVSALRARMAPEDSGQGCGPDGVAVQLVLA